MGKKKEFHCEYCGRRLQKFEYEFGNGYCGKCRNVIDWKKTLSDMKEFNE